MSQNLSEIFSDIRDFLQRDLYVGHVAIQQGNLPVTETTAAIFGPSTQEHLDQGYNTTPTAASSGGLTSSAAVLLPRQLIPQRQYQPCSRERRLVDNATFGGLITFKMQNGGDFLLRRALEENYSGLIERDNPFIHPSTTICIVIEWPGYELYKRRIKTVDWRRMPRPITVAKLSKEIAKSFQIFMQREQSTIPDKGYNEWRVGPDLINIDRLALCSLRLVGRNSWQPEFRYLPG